MLRRINWLALCLLSLSLAIVAEAQTLRAAADARGLRISAAVNMSPFRNEAAHPDARAGIQHARRRKRYEVRRDASGSHLQLHGRRRAGRLRRSQRHGCERSYAGLAQPDSRLADRGNFTRDRSSPL